MSRRGQQRALENRATARAGRAPRRSRTNRVISSTRSIWSPVAARMREAHSLCRARPTPTQEPPGPGLSAGRGPPEWSMGSTRQGAALVFAISSLPLAETIVIVRSNSTYTRPAPRPSPPHASFPSSHTASLVQRAFFTFPSDHDSGSQSVANDHRPTRLDPA